MRTAQVVYVNYGTPADFERLHGMGISVEGKIALVRYGGGVPRAEGQGGRRIAAPSGVLIYSDPADDGYARGDVYPDGPMRPPLGDPARLGAVPLARAGRPVDAGRAPRPPARSG